MLCSAIGESRTFLVFAALCVAAHAFVWRFVPETKGRSLEEIQEDWGRIRAKPHRSAGPLQ